MGISSRSHLFSRQRTVALLKLSLAASSDLLSVAHLPNALKTQLQEVLSVTVSWQGKGTANIGTSKEHHVCLMDTSSNGNKLFADGDFFAELGCVESTSLHFPNMQFAVIFLLPHYIAQVASYLEIRGFKIFQ